MRWERSLSDWHFHIWAHEMREGSVGLAFYRQATQGERFLSGWDFLDRQIRCEKELCRTGIFTDRQHRGELSLGLGFYTQADEVRDISVGLGFYNQADEWEQVCRTWMFTLDAKDLCRTSWCRQAEEGRDLSD